MRTDTNGAQKKYMTMLRSGITNQLTTKYVATVDWLWHNTIRGVGTDRGQEMDY